MSTNLYTGRGNVVEYDRLCDYLTVLAVVEIGVIVVVLLSTASKTFITAEGVQTLEGWRRETGQGMVNGKKFKSTLWTEIRIRSGVVRCERGRVKTMAAGRRASHRHMRIGE